MLLIEKALYPNSEAYNQQEQRFLTLCTLSLSFFDLAVMLNQLQDAQLMFKLGTAFYDQSRVFPAIECFEKALRLSPNLAETDAADLYHRLACFYMIAGNVLASEKVFEKILSQQSAQVFISYALLLFREQRYAEGIQYCTKVIDLETPLEPSWEYTQVYFKVLPACLKQQISMPENKWLLSSRALAYFLLLYYKDYLNNQSLIQQYLESFHSWVYSSNDPDHLLLLGYAYEHLNEMQKALVCFQKALAVSNETCVSAQRNIQRLINIEGDEKIFQIDIEKLMQLGKKSLKNGLYDNALACFKDCLLVSDAEDFLYLVIGCVYHAKQEMQVATVYFEKVRKALNTEGFPPK